MNHDRTIHRPHRCQSWQRPVLSGWQMVRSEDDRVRIAEAVTPSAHALAHKYWPAVNRVDNVFGDRNLFCACAPVEDYRD